MKRPPTKIERHHNSPLLSPLQAFIVLVSCALAVWIVGGAGFNAPVSILLALVFIVGEYAVGVFSDGLTLGTRDVSRILGATAASGALLTLIHFALPQAFGLTLTSIIVAALLVIVLSVVLRLAVVEAQRRVRKERPDAQPVIVVGSGKTAASLVELIQEHQNYSVVGCVDDEILSTQVANKQILGTVDALPRLISEHKISCVIIAIPYATTQLIKRIMNICLTSEGRDGKPPAVKILPGVLELLEDGAKASRIRPVQPEDLLPREPVKVEIAEISPHVANRVILVTGAGGSIGSELCRQIVGLNPSLLLLLGHGENSLFDIAEELRQKHGFNRTKIILGNVSDAARIRCVFSRYRPHVVFHSAAHKHVPIVETNVCEAVRNNILGTHVVALAAAAAGTAKFVLLSTDKAVNPTSVMGATKRVSELISQSFFNQTGTEFVTVRFGNVLESRGSVIPIFKRQIENGGPVTVTHRDMQRYFMTIPEAASLVLMAMAIGRDGQVLVLDMGQPVKIMRLAETLITLSGLTPYRDIAIVETGVRPGEKLFEEMLTSYEGFSATSHSRLFTAQQERIAYDSLAASLESLELGVKSGDTEAVLRMLQQLVPSFQPGMHLLEDRQHAGEFSIQKIPGPTAPADTLAQRNGHAEKALLVEISPNRIEERSQTTGVIGS